MPIHCSRKTLLFTSFSVTREGKLKTQEKKSEDKKRKGKRKIEWFYEALYTFKPYKPFFLFWGQKTAISNYFSRT